jgi:hypothetical protein
MKYLVLVSFALLSATSYAQQPQGHLVIRCTPGDSALFQFEISQTRGCETTPAGQRCEQKVDLAIFGMDPQSHQWTYAGGVTGFPDEIAVDQMQKTFYYHYADAFGVEHIDVEVVGNLTAVNIKAQGDFDLVPHIDTKGQQTMYRCTLL